MTSLYDKYRPHDLDDMIGNGNVVESIRALLSREVEAFPHAMLFVGGSGCGKTTLARIVARELGCNMEMDYKEVDSADFRGIDSIRDLRQQMRLRPMAGKVRVFLLDECFHRDTLVESQDGPTPIHMIVPGDRVYSMTGLAKVREHFINRIPLERTMRLTLEDGTVMVCSQEHAFFTGRGWIPAKNLLPEDVLFPMRRDIMDAMSSQKESIHEDNTPMSSMRNTNGVLPKSTGEVQQENVLNVVFSEGTDDTSRSSSRPVQPGGGSKDWSKSSGLPDEHSTGETGTGSTFAKDEGTKSLCLPPERGEREGDQSRQGDSSRMEGGSGRERNLDRTTEIAGTRAAMGDGDCHSREGSTRVSKCIQGGHCEQATENRSGSGRGGAQIEKEFAARYEENRGSCFSRVASIEIYEPGDHAGFGPGCFTRDEVDQGFTELHDLEIEGHPSYFAGGVCVHNCHKLTNDAQNALLKLLESPPAHGYILMATTDPGKLLPTIKTRCTTYEVQPLTEQKIISLCKRVCRSEKSAVDAEVMELIARNSLGSPRMALSILDSLIDLPADQQASMVETAASQESATIDFCRALSKKGTPWSKIAPTIRNLTDDPENIRRAVLGYFSSILLKTGDAHAALVLSCFKEPTYNIGKPGIVLAAYEVLCG